MKKLDLTDLAVSQMYETIRLGQDAKLGHEVTKAVRETVFQAELTMGRYLAWDDLIAEEKIAWSRCAVRLWRLFEQVNEHMASEQEEKTRDLKRPE